MSVQNYTLAIIQGSTLSLSCSVVQGGVPFNLTGYTIAGKIRRLFSDAAVYQSLTVAITNAAGGLFSISLTGTETAALTTASANPNTRDQTIGVYDIEITTGATVTRILQGITTLSQEATK